MSWFSKRDYGTVRPGWIRVWIKGPTPQQPFHMLLSEEAAPDFSVGQRVDLAFHLDGSPIPYGFSNHWIVTRIESS